MTKQVDDERCEKCGQKLEPIYEHHETWGKEIFHEVLECPVCKE